MSLAKRKASMVPSEGRRKASVEGKKSLELPQGEGRRDSLGRRGSILGARRMSISDRKYSTAESLAGRSGMLSASKDGRQMNIKIENTYKLEPDEIFPISMAKSVAKEVLQSTLHDKTYTKEDCARWSRELSDRIKQRIKAQGCPHRFKVVVIVAIGQTQESQPSLSFTSRCIWNAKLDNFAEATFESKHLFAVALVYAISSD